MLTSDIALAHWVRASRAQVCVDLGQGCRTHTVHAPDLDKKRVPKVGNVVMDKLVLQAVAEIALEGPAGDRTRYNIRSLFHRTSTH